jgi:hypothetical protein
MTTNMPRVLCHMVLADFLERVRRYSFLLTLAFAVYVAYAAFTEKIVLRLDDYRGIYNSAWLGGLMGVVCSAFLSLVGFYVVKNSIQRDQQTRVGQVLAATPMTKRFYTFAKSISNFAVLAAMVLVMGAAAVVMQLLRGEDPHLHLWSLLAPLALFALPAMAFVAALAVLFETLPVLRGGIGNVIFFFLWILLLVGGGIGSLEKGAARNTIQYFEDFTGIVAEMDDMQAAVRKVDPAYKGGSALNIGDTKPRKRFVWAGIRWTPLMYESRLFWLLAAAFVAWLASFPFHRFDPAREWAIRRKLESSVPSAPPATPEQFIAHAKVEDLSAHLSPLAFDAKTQSGMLQTVKLRSVTLENKTSNPFLRLVAAELRLMLQGQRWWWYIVAAGLSIACLVTPLKASRGGILIAAWIWPILVWSQMGSREARFGTESLLFSCARSLGRQLPALWTAGVIVSLLTGGGVGIRLLLSSDWHSLAAWFAGACFIPSFAMACGVWSGSGKMFEAIYTVWWYIGPANQTPGLDFMGVSSASSTPGIYAVATVLLVAVAYYGRRAHMAYV